uniref:Uncharacterized protein n=1 Tax=Arundo donax TaxID=35708 RepID=A0A0A8Y7U8_ARUDO
MPCSRGVPNFSLVGHRNAALMSRLIVGIYCDELLLFV